MSSVLRHAGLLQRQGGITPVAGVLEWKDGGPLGRAGTGGKEELSLLCQSLVGEHGAPSRVHGAQPRDG